MKTQKNIIIPTQVLKQCHLRPNGPLNLCAGENTLVALPKTMTALQTVNAINVLTGIAADLIDALKDACGTCGDRMEREEGCPFGAISDPEQCPYENMDGPEVELSDAARRELGIPLDAKLQLYPDVGEGLVSAADYEHDITDVPDNIRVLLAMAEVCPGQLDRLIMDGTEVWHG